MITHPLPQWVWYVLFICHSVFVIIPLSVGSSRVSLQIFPFLNFLKFYVVSFHLPLGLFIYLLLLGRFITPDL